MAKDETRAQTALRRAGIAFRSHALPVATGAKTTAMEMAQQSDIDPARLFKTLIVAGAPGAQLSVAIVPANAELDRKRLSTALKVKRIDMAPLKAAEAATGYRAGAISPFGQKKRLPTFLDESALSFETIFVSGARFGLEIEIAPSDLLAATDGRTLPLARGKRETS